MKDEYTTDAELDTTEPTKRSGSGKAPYVRPVLHKISAQATQSHNSDSTTPGDPLGDTGS